MAITDCLLHVGTIIFLILEMKRWIHEEVSNLDSLLMNVAAGTQNSGNLLPEALLLTTACYYLTSSNIVHSHT